MKPVCLVIGAGAGIGGTVGMRFAREGYHSVLCRRTGQEALESMVGQIEQDGGLATGFIINAIEADSIGNLIAKVEADIGPIRSPSLQSWFASGKSGLSGNNYKTFEMGWRLATFGLFRAPSTACP